jgi:hypothetical protein
LLGFGDLFRCPRGYFDPKAAWNVVCLDGIGDERRGRGGWYAWVAVWRSGDLRRRLAS